MIEVVLAVGLVMVMFFIAVAVGCFILKGMFKIADWVFGL